MSEIPDTLTRGFLRGLKIETLFVIEDRVKEDIALASDPEEAMIARDNIRLVQSELRQREASL